MTKKILTAFIASFLIISLTSSAFATQSELSDKWQEIHNKKSVLAMEANRLGMKYPGYREPMSLILQQFDMIAGTGVFTEELDDADQQNINIHQKLAMVNALPEQFSALKIGFADKPTEIKKFFEAVIDFLAEACELVKQELLVQLKDGSAKDDTDRVPLNWSQEERKELLQHVDRFYALKSKIDIEYKDEDYAKAALNVIALTVEGLIRKADKESFSRSELDVVIEGLDSTAKTHPEILEWLNRIPTDRKDVVNAITELNNIHLTVDALYKKVVLRAIHDADGAPVKDEL